MEVTVRTEGGHSYADFGNKNAIAYLARMITTLYAVEVPHTGRTTYNVGLISGGTSVNTIAQEARMAYEFRF
jgi:acetylornithine deacetylase/succinyl-diaminopimelate desuccinylase-like protein